MVRSVRNNTTRHGDSEAQDADDPPATDRRLREFAGYNLKRATHRMQSQVTRTLAEFDLRTLSFSTLVLIVDNPGLRQSELAAVLAVERPNMVAVIDQLESRQLVSRRTHPDDRRAQAISPTAAGRRLCERALAALRVTEAEVLASLNARERDTLSRLLQRVETTAGEAS